MGSVEMAEKMGSEGSFFDPSDPISVKSILSVPVVLEGVTDAAVKNAAQWHRAFRTILMICSSSSRRRGSCITTESGTAWLIQNGGSTTPNGLKHDSASLITSQRRLCAMAQKL